ncbi:MAG: PEGA domain-containing protein [Nitrospirota bacterium]
MRKFFFLSFLLFILVFPSAGFCKNPKLAVFPFENNGQPKDNGLSSGLSVMFFTNLAKMQNVDVIDPQKVSDAIYRLPLSGGAPTVKDSLKAAAGLGASYAVMGDYVIFGGRFRIDVRVYDVRSGTIKFIDKAQSTEDAMFDMVDKLSGRMVAAMAGELPPVPGEIQIKTEPDGATLYVDGEKAGTTPATVKDLKVGMHKIRLDLAGYQEYKQKVGVEKGKVAKVDVKLIRLYGGVRIWWQQFPTSDIALGNETISVSHFQDIYLAARFCRNVPSGDYKVVVRMPYKKESSWNPTPTWRTYSSEVTISPGEVTDISIDNNLYSPGIQIGACGSCAASWDFTTKMSWYEMK